MAADERTDVLVAGAGPTGLMLANWLRKLGVRVIVADGKAGPTRESRALIVQARSLEIYDQLGLGEQVLAAARPAVALAPGTGARVFGKIPIGAIGSGQTPHPAVEVLEQSHNEEILYANLRELGGDVRWESPVTDLTLIGDGSAGYGSSGDGPGGDGLVGGGLAGGGLVRGGLAGGGLAGYGVRATVGGRTVLARFCVGADGANSVVRRSRGIAFDGVTNPHRFYVIDAVAAAGLVEDAINVRPSGPEFMIAFPMRGRGNWRLIGVARDSDASAHDSDGDIGGDSAGGAGGGPTSGGPTSGGPSSGGPSSGGPSSGGSGGGDSAGGDSGGSEVEERDARDRLRAHFAVTYDHSNWYATYKVHHRVAAAFRDGPFFLAGDAAHVHSPVGGQGMNTGLQDAHNLAFKLADVLQGRATDAWLDRYEAERRPVAKTLVATTDRLFGFITSRHLGPSTLRRLAVPLLAPVGVRVLPRTGGGSRFFGYVSQTRIHYQLSPPAEGPRDPVVGRRLPWTGGNYEVLRSLQWQIHAYGGMRPEVPGLDLEVHSFPPAPRTSLRPDRLYLVRPDGFVAAQAEPADAAGVFTAAMPARPPSSPA